MKTRIIIAISLFLLVALGACQKDIDEIKPIDPPPTGTSKIAPIDPPPTTPSVTNTASDSDLQ